MFIVACLFYGKDKRGNILFFVSIYGNNKYIVVKIIYGNKKSDNSLFFVSVYGLKNEKVVWSYKIIFEMKNCDEKWCGWKINRGKN